MQLMICLCGFEASAEYHKQDHEDWTTGLGDFLSCNELEDDFLLLEHVLLWLLTPVAACLTVLRS